MHNLQLSNCAAPPRSSTWRVAAMTAALLTLAVPVAQAQITGSAGAQAIASSGGASGTPGNIGSLTDDPITPGETVHVMVYDAPDLSVTTRVSESGDIAVPLLGVLHFAGLNSTTAVDLLTRTLKERSIMLDPQVTVTVDSNSTDITLLGEVRTPGLYPVPGKRTLSDLLAQAGGLMATTGRVIEISNPHMPGHVESLAWDPTMHDVTNYDHPITAGDRILVRSCGFVYVGGHVARPGAYPLCGSQKMTVSELVAMASGTVPLTDASHSVLLRRQPDGTRVAQQINLPKLQKGLLADPEVHEEDIIYVSPSPVKEALNRALQYTVQLTQTLLYIYRPAAN